MHIATAVEKIIIPLLEKLEGQHVSNINFPALRKEIYRSTGKDVNFRVIDDNAIRLLESEAKGNFVSFNIEVTPECMTELECSSQARRDRFRHLVGEQLPTKGRVGMMLEAIRSNVCFTINFVPDLQNNTISFKAIVAYYGSSINPWAERVGLRQTEGVHSIPSTHYMPRTSAPDYIFVLAKKVSLSRQEGFFQ